MGSSGKLITVSAGAITTAEILDGTIVNADVNAAAAIVASKLAAGGTANRVVATANGTTMALQQIVGDMIADSTITSAKLTGGLPPPTNSVSTNEIVDGTILNVDINASAAIDVSKLANGTRGQVLMGGVSAAAYAPIARKNLLVNGAMRVCQRAPLDTGVTMVDNTYQSADRWRSLYNGTAPNVTWGSGIYANPGSNNRSQVLTSKGGTTKFGIIQMLEALDVIHARTRVVSLQAKLYATAGITNVRMALLSWSGTADAVSADPISAWNADGTNPTLAGSWAYVNTPASLGANTVFTTVYKLENQTVPLNTTNLAVMIWCDDTTHTSDTDQIAIVDVQLELGPVCTDVERVPLGAEVAACQRFYEEIGSGVSNENFGAGLWILATDAICNVPYKVRKRATPTMLISAVGDFFVYAVTNPITCTSVGNQSVSQDFWGARITVASGGTAGQGTCFAGATSSARIKISAEL